jgi:hypothetical protein
VILSGPMRASLVLVAVSWVAGCGDNHLRSDANVPDGVALDGAIDAMADASPDANPLNPMTLADTGLCRNAACTQVSSEVHAYVPRFQLWADGATKKRWMYLPPGTKIDTSDPDHWVFPMGTRFWKEFTRGSVRVETRYIAKVLPDEAAPDAWFYISFAWNQTQDATTAVTAGRVNVNGTTHDIPARSDCQVCHDNVNPGRVLGFQAIQLDATDPDGLLDLDRIDALGWLTRSPPAKINGAHYPFPVATQAQADALGYMHANCGHCHNPSSRIQTDTPMVLRLDTTKLATLTGTPTYLTTTNQPGITISENGTPFTTLVIPKDPDHSIVNVRVNTTTTNHMPPLGTELTDPRATELILGWINSL